MPKTNKKKISQPTPKNKIFGGGSFVEDNLFDKLAEASFDGVVVHRKGIILATNPMLKKLFGYKTSPIGKSIIAYVTTESKKIVFEKVKQDSEDKYEAEMLRENGTTFNAELIGRKIIYEGRQARVTAIRDITSQKKYEQALKKSEEEYRLLFKVSPVPMFVYSRNTHKILQVNDAAIKKYGYSEKEFLSKTIKDIRPKEEAKKLVEHEKKNQKDTSNVRYHGLWKHLKKDGKIIDVEISTTSIYMNGEVCDLTTINDVTETIRTKNLLIESEKNFSQVLEKIDEFVYYFEYDEKGLPQPKYVGSQSEKLMGLTVKEYLKSGYKLLEDCHPEDVARMLAASKKIKKEKEPQVERYRYKLKSWKEYKWIEERIFPQVDAKGKHIGNFGIMRDVTEQAKASQEIVREKDKLKHYLDVAGILLVALDANQNVLLVNQKGCEVLGYKEEEIIGKNWYEHFVPKVESKKRKNNFLKRFATDSTIFQVENEILTKSGKKRRIAWKDSILFDDDKKPIAMISSGEDITEKRLAEIALRESESRFKLLSKATNEGIAIIDNDGVIIDSNDQYAHMYGMKAASEIIGISCLSLIAPESKNIVKERIANNISGLYRCWCLKVDGTKFLMEVHSRKIPYNGLEVRMSAVTDVTESQKYENELKQSRANYKSLVDYSPDGVFIHVDGKVKFANPSALRIIEADNFEQVSEQLVLKFLLPEYHTLAIDRIKQTKKGQLMPFYEVKATTLKGNKIELEIKAMPIKYNGENAIQVVVHDTTIEKNFLKEQLRAQVAEEQKEKLEREIAVRKKIQQELQKSEEKYRAIYDQAHIGIARTDLKGKFLQVNHYLSGMLGFTQEEFVGKSVLEYTHPEDVQKTKESFTEKISGKTDKTRLEKRYIHKSGKNVFVEVTGSAIKDIDGSPMYFLSVIEDVTEKRENEKELITKSAKINAIFQNSSHLIYTVSRDGILTSYNDNYRQITEFAYGGSPKVGSRLFISSSKEKSISKQFLDQATLSHQIALSGISQQYEQKVVGQDGQVKWFEISLDPIVLPDGKIEEVSYIAHDITEKKENEIQIGHSLQEKEVLLKEVHHRVKNNLQVISSILNLQSSSAKDPAILDLLKESQNRIKSMAYIHENLYRTNDFANIKFSEYLITLAENLVYSYATNRCPIELNLEIENIFINLDLAIPCGLIVNELMTNALKYAFKDRASGKITIELKEKNERITLSVIDNGVGFPKAVDYKNTESLGLQLVVTLTEQLSGTITQEVNNGTRFSIEFNQKTKKNG
ncbi:MAG: PAS domain S-box protein [Bacteroidia bacterium]